MEGILYIAHGTRSKKGISQANQFLTDVIRKIPYPVQEISFLELAEPTIEEGFARCVAKGASVITVVPLFLHAAGHLKKDIPAILSFLKKRYPEVTVFLKEAFGVRSEIIDGIAEMAEGKVGKISCDDTLLIIGRGSSDPDIQDAFSEIGRRLQKRLGVIHHKVCYLASAKPDLREGFEWAAEKAAAQNRRILAVPYLLFSGFLFSEVKEQACFYEEKEYQIYLTEPLSTHPSIKKAVIQCVIGKEKNDATAFD